MAQEHADDELTQQIAYHKAEARKMRDELAKRKEQRREDAFAQRCLRDSKSVEQRKERDLAIIDAILDGETRISIGTRLGLLPQTVSSIYDRFEWSLKWPSSGEAAYRDYPPELVAKWAVVCPDEAGRAKYWYERAFAEASAIPPEDGPGSEDWESDKKIVDLAQYLCAKHDITVLADTEGWTSAALRGMDEQLVALRQVLRNIIAIARTNGASMDDVLRNALAFATTEAD